MSTGRDYINGALEILGVRAGNQSLRDSDANIGLRFLNAMLDSWSSKMDAIYAETQEAFTLTSADSTYTIGPSGDFVTTRPLKFLRAKVRDVQGIDHALNLMPNKEFQDYLLKSPGDSLPWSMGINMTIPDIELEIYPPPDTTYSLRLTTLKPLAAATLSSTYTVPPGYDLTIMYNLAVLLAAPFGSSDILGSPLNAASISGMASRLYREMIIANTETEGTNTDPMLPDGDYTIRSWKTDN